MIWNSSTTDEEVTVKTVDLQQLLVDQALGRTGLLDGDISLSSTFLEVLDRHHLVALKHLLQPLMCLHTGVADEHGTLATEGHRCTSTITCLTLHLYQSSAVNKKG